MVFSSEDLCFKFDDAVIFHRYNVIFVIQILNLLMEYFWEISSTKAHEWDLFYSQFMVIKT